MIYYVPVCWFLNSNPDSGPGGHLGCLKKSGKRQRARKGLGPERA